MIVAAANLALSSVTSKQYVLGRSNVTLNCLAADINCDLGELAVIAQDLIHLSDPFLAPLPTVATPT